MATKTYEFERRAVEQIKGARERIGAELSKVIVGQEDVIEHLIIAVLSGGHCLITGVSFKQSSSIATEQTEPARRHSSFAELVRRYYENLGGGD